MRVYRFGINCLTGIQLPQTFRKPNFDPARCGVNARADFSRQRNKQFAGRCGHDEVPGFRQAALVLLARSLHVLHWAERSSRAIFPNLAADQVCYIVPAVSQPNALAERDLHIEPAQSFRIRDRLNSVEVKNRLSEMNAAGNDLGGTRSVALACQPGLSHLREPLREIRQDFSGYLTVPAPWTQNARKGYRVKQFW
jgi:hypothetical protein